VVPPVYCSTATSSSIATSTASGSTSFSSWPRPSPSISPDAMYRSVGKLPVSDSTTRRSRRMSSAAASAWYILIDRVSPVVTDPAGAPTSLAIRSPTRLGWIIQPQSFQPRIRRSPHSAAIISATRARAAFGSGPSELPSR